MKIFIEKDRRTDVMMVRVDNKEACEIIKSLAAQMASGSANGERAEHYTSDGTYFSIAVVNSTQPKATPSDTTLHWVGACIEQTAKTIFDRFPHIRSIGWMQVSEEANKGIDVPCSPSEYLINGIRYYEDDEPISRADSAFREVNLRAAGLMHEAMKIMSAEVLIEVFGGECLITIRRGDLGKTRTDVKSGAWDAEKRQFIPSK